MAESTAPNAPIASAATADELVEGIAVSWTDPEGVIRTGIVSDVNESGDSDGEIATVTIVPDDDPENPVEVPIESVELVVAQDGVDAPERSDDEVDDAEDVADDTAEAVEPKFDVVEGHPECADSADGTVAVIIFEDGNEEGEGRVDSCWTDTDAAQAHIEALLNPDADETNEDDAPVESFDFSDETKPKSNLSELERAAALADKVRETMDMLTALSPELKNAAASTDEKSSSFDDLIANVEENAVVVVEDETPEDAPVMVDVTKMSQEDLIAELARRFAEETAAELGSDQDDAVELNVEIDVEVGDAEVVEAAAEAPTEAAVEVVVEEPVEAAEVVEEPAAEVEGDEDDAVEAASDFDWDGVLIVEGLPSGDGRMIAAEALTWRELPIPLMLQTVNAQGHEGAIICGSIHSIEREGQNILGSGNFDSGAAGQEALRLLTEGTMRGVSADIDSVVVEFLTEDGNAVSIEDVMMNGVEALEVLVEGRIMGATLTPFPAFQEAHVKVIAAASPDEAMVASGSSYQGDVWRVPSPIGMWVAGQEQPTIVASARLNSLVASAAAAEIVSVPAKPPVAWFDHVEMEEPTPFTVHPDGRCFGLIARFGSCHIGFQDRCVDVPRTGSNYKHFLNKSVLADDGSESGVLVATGNIFMDTVHPNLRLKASDAAAHYADTGCAVADVTLYENDFGIVAAGALRPDLTESQVRRFRGSDVSPDWRSIKGRLEAVGLLSVNVSGFVVEGLVASGAEVSYARGRFDSVANEVTALVAAGMVQSAKFSELEHAERDAVIDDLADQVTSLRDALEEFVLTPAREARLAAARAKLGIKDPEVVHAERIGAALARFGSTSVDKNASNQSAGSIESDTEVYDINTQEVVEASVEADCGGSCGAGEDTCACKH